MEHKENYRRDFESHLNDDPDFNYSADEFDEWYSDLFEQQAVELVMWETVRSDCKYPITDNNNGLIYGLNLLSCNDIEDAEVLDVQWFSSDEARFEFIKENQLNIINND